MRRRVIIHEDAEREIDQIARFIARDSIDAALRFYDAVERAGALLLRMPRIGRRRIAVDPSLAELRSWPLHGFRNYIIFYRPVKNGVEILHLIHGARDIQGEFGIE